MFDTSTCDLMGRRGRDGRTRGAESFDIETGSYVGTDVFSQSSSSLGVSSLGVCPRVNCV